MPPEQAAGERVDARADVYALGAILYHVLVGQAPYRGRNDAVLAAVKAGPPPAVATAAPDAPRDLVSIVDKAMARDPADRYESARELAGELTSFQAGRLVEAHHYSRGELVRRWILRRRAAVGVSAIALLVLVTGGAFAVANVVGERDRAEIGEHDAVEQRRVADAARTKAQRENASLMEEQGRQELLAGNTTRALAWLDEAYKAGDDSPALRFMLGTGMRQIESVEHAFECGGSVGTVDLSPDQTQLMASCGQAIKIWRLADGALVTTITTASAGAVYSHDGRRIASNQDATLSIWDAATGAPVFSRREHTAKIRSVAFSLDDRTLITTGDDAMVRVWNAATGTVTHVLPAGSGKMNVVRGELTQDGKTFISTTARELITWDPITWQRRRTITLPVQAVYDGPASSPDGSRYVTCGIDGTVRLWDLGSGRELATLAAHAHAAFSCSFSHDGRQILSSGIDGLVKVWDVDARRLVATLPHGGSILRGRFSPDDQRVATIGGDGRVKVWHVATGSLIASLDDPFAIGGNIALFSRDGRRFITAREPFTIVVTKDLSAGVAPRRLPDGASIIKMSPTGAQLAMKTAAGTVSIVDATTLVAVAHEALREPVAWSGDGARFAASAVHGDVAVIDTHTGATLASVATAAPPDSLELDAGGHRLLVPGAPPRVWDVDHQRIELALDGRSHASSLAPTGGLVVAWQDPKRPEVWSIDRHAIVQTLALETELDSVIGYDHDARHVVLGEKEGDMGMSFTPYITQLAIYDVATGARIFKKGGRLFTTLDPTQHWLASSGLGAKVEILDADDGKLVSRLSPGPAFFVAGQVVPGGALVLVADGATLDLRNVSDGRLLASMRPLMATSASPRTRSRRATATAT